MVQNDGDPLEIRILSSDRRSVVSLKGELDVYTSAPLRVSLARLIAAGARHVVVDLRDLSFMTASGLGVLVGAAQRLRRQDGTLELRSPRPAVRKLIEITGLRGMLPFAPACAPVTAPDGRHVRRPPPVAVLPSGT